LEVKQIEFIAKHVKTVVILGAVAASFSAIFTRLVTEAPPLVIGFYRLLFALPFFVIPTLLWHRRELKALSIKLLWPSVLSGFFLAMHFYTWFIGVDNTSIASAVVLCSTHPIFILLIGVILFRERPHPKVVVGILIALTGGAIITGGDYNFSQDAIFGDLMSLTAAFFLAVYFFFGKTLRKHMGAMVYVTIVFTSCWLTFLVLVLSTKTPIIGYPAADYISIFAMSMVCQIGAHAVFNWCLGHVSPLFISTMETGESLIATVMAMILFAEYPASWQIIGGGITLAGLLYYNYNDSKIVELKALV
jgi:drug/metabolite transporter (DMT)-like permease